jgi:hypothetical protein
MKKSTITSGLILTVLLCFGLITDAQQEVKKPNYRCLKTQGSNCTQSGGEITGTCGLRYSVEDPCEKKYYYEDPSGVSKEAKCCSKLLGITNQWDYPNIAIGSIYELYTSFETNEIYGITGSDTFPIINFDSFLEWYVNDYSLVLMDTLNAKITVYQDDTLSPYVQGLPNTHTITYQNVEDAYGAYLFGSSSVLGIIDKRAEFDIIEYPSLECDFVLSKTELKYKFSDLGAVTQLLSIVVTDLSGKEIVRSTPTTSTGFITLNGNLSSGVYIISIVTSWEQTSKKLFLE